MELTLLGDKRGEAIGDLRDMPLFGRMATSVKCELAEEQVGREGMEGVRPSDTQTWGHRPNLTTGLVLENFTGM